LTDRIFRQKTASEYTFEKNPNTMASAQFWNIGPKLEHLWGHGTNYRTTCDDILGYRHGFPNIGEKSLHLAIPTRLLWKIPDGSWVQAAPAKALRQHCHWAVRQHKGAQIWRRAGLIPY
jgi:hypothetical protein